MPEIGDPYNPAVSGICSFFIPGMGQIICGETGRGLAFFGGYLGCIYLSGAGMAISWSEEKNSRIIGSTIFLLCLSGVAVIEIWSAADAIKVAKVNNMYIRDLRKTSALNLEIAPYVTQLNINNQLTTPVGMTMRVKF